MSGSWDVGKRVAGAATLAVERVNADQTLLPGRRLEYSWANSGCSAQQALSAIGKLLGGVSRISAVIGPGCSSACEVTSYLVAGQGIPQVSWGCSASSLSNKANHRLVWPCYPYPASQLSVLLAAALNCVAFDCHALFDCGAVF